MKRAWLGLALFLRAISYGQTPAGWKTFKDKTGACQMSVPGDWVLSSLPGHAISPEKTEAVVLVGLHNGLRPLTPDTEQGLGIARMFENTRQRLFYVGAPSAAQNGIPPLVSYHVTVPGREHVCISQITVKQGHSEDEVKKIAATLSAVK